MNKIVMDRIIFLDIDGVLNNEELWRQCDTEDGLINSKLVKKLNQLSIYPEVKIVISSSWGYDDGRTEAVLKSQGLTIPIVGYTEHFHRNYLCRGNEIEKYLVDTYGGMATKYGSQYINGKYEYVILDDDCDMLYGQKDNFIRTDSYKGLTDEDIANMLRILKLDEN